MKFIVITTINGLTEAIKKYTSSKFSDWQVIVVGDNKTPYIKSFGNLTFLSVQDQEKLGYHVIKNIPYNQYCRKNIGYLYAMKNDAEIIYETDDDNHPYNDWKVPNDFNVTYRSLESDFVNICTLYTKKPKKIWPRGFPLELITTENKLEMTVSQARIKPGVIQTLADNDPDVDAIYRLVSSKPVKFYKDFDVILAPGTFTPFNSQSTFWNKETFSFMYFPMYVGWRFADILRGYITQKLLWDIDSVLGYSSPIVYQERNPHNYMVDFNQELVLYNSIMPTINTIKSLNKPSIVDIYTELYKAGIVKREEIRALKLWLKSI
jgi:hypothetical protein